MTSLKRKIRRKLGRKSDTLENQNADFFRIFNRGASATHLRQDSATKGARRMNRARLTIAQMTPAQRWELVVLPTIAAAQRHAKKIGYHA